MKKLWMMISMALISSAAMTAENPYVYITIGSDAVQSTQKSFTGISKINSADGISVVKINKNQIEKSKVV